MTASSCPTITNPIWQAATTRQQRFAYGEGKARRYDREVLPFAALEDHSPQAVASLTAMVAPGERVWLFEEPPQLNPHDWREVRRIPGYQMVLERLTPRTRRAAGPSSVMLHPVADAAAMSALKAVAFPGFFGARTPQLGRYRGIRVNGELVAMAGERLAVPGFREVSAICTHPDHLGRGYAQQLTREATEAILADGDRPFLHAAGGNAAALHIYEQLGYIRSADALFVQLERLPAAANSKGR